MADLSKITISGTSYTLKDAAYRALLDNVISITGNNPLGTVAVLNVAASMNDSALIANAGTVKDYVDAQIETIPSFDVVVVTELPEASADTFHKIYLIAEGAISGTYAEYITIRSGVEGSYTYAWEKIGTTAIDLTDYVKKETTIAGINLASNISQADMRSALNMGAMANVATASGSTTLNTVDSITMDSITIAGDATVGHINTAASLVKANYTPSGNVTGSVTPTGNVSVDLKNADTKTEATLTTETFTPAGTVTGNVSVPDAAALAKDDDNGVAISGNVSKPSITVTPSNVTVLGGVNTAGTLPSFSEGTFTPASLTKSNASVATEAFVATVNGEAEELILTTANTVSVLKSDSAFDGGSKAADTFSAGAMPTFDDATVINGATAALDAAPAFTGDKFKINLSSNDATIDAAFTATATATIVNKVEYYKQVVNSATFEGDSDIITASFAGDLVENALVDNVYYDKANASAAFSETVTPTVNEITTTAKTISITVNPDVA